MTMQDSDEVKDMVNTEKQLCRYLLPEAACATNTQTQTVWYGLIAVQATIDEWGRVIVVFQQ